MMTPAIYSTSMSTEASILRHLEERGFAAVTDVPADDRADFYLSLAARITQDRHANRLAHPGAFSISRGLFETTVVVSIPTSDADMLDVVESTSLNAIGATS